MMTGGTADDRATGARSLVLLGVLLAALMGLLGFIGFGPVEPLTLCLAVAGLIGLGAGLFGFRQSVVNPAIPFFVLLFMNIFVYVLPKADYLAAAVGFATALVYVARNFNTIVRNPISLSMLIFVIINVLYWQFYSTDFVVGKIILANGNVFNKESNNEQAKTIVLLASLCPLISYCVVTNAFTTCGAKVLSLLKKYYPYAALVFSILTLVFSVSGAKLDIAGQTLILPMVFLFNIFYWLAIRDEKTPVSEPVYWMAQAALLVGIFLKANKTTLIGVILILSLYVAGLRWINGSLGIQKRVKAFFSNPTLLIIMGLGLMMALAAAYVLGIFDLIASKIDYFYNGLSKGSTLNVRTSNWSYFFADWQDKLNPLNVLFGFGSAVSRKTIFYISAGRHSFPNNNVLVQTLHNAYLEFAYDYGLMAVFYWLPTWLLLKKHVPAIFSGQSRQWRLASLTLVSTIAFISFYAFMDGIRIQVAIYYYFLLITYNSIYDLQPDAVVQTAHHAVAD